MNLDRRRFPLAAAAFLITFCCYLLLFRTAGVGLFSGKSILISDMQTQYISFFSALRQGDFFYSDGLFLSGSFAGSFAYYLSSPFSLLIFLFSPERLQTALLLILILKMSSAAFSFVFAASAFRLPPVPTLLFSLCYALMSFPFYFFINLFWLDAFLYLPLLAAAVYRLAQNGKRGALPFLLALLFLSNFYISYIVGLFLCLFCLALCFSLRLSLQETGKRVLSLAISALLALGMAAVVLCPASFDIVKGLSEPAFSAYGMFNFTPKQFFLKLFIGHYDSIGNLAAPTILSGTVVLLLSVSYFFLPSIPKREKIAAGSLVMLFLLSFLLPQLDIVWHAFSYPNAFAYRYAFCFSFLLILLAGRSFRLAGEIPRTLLMLFFLPALAILAFYQKLRPHLAPSSILLTAAALLIVTLLLLLLRREKHAVSLLSALLLVFTVFELSMNGAGILASMQEEGKETSYPFPAYTNWVDQRRQSLDLLSMIEPHNHRTVHTGADAANAGAALFVRGVSGFSSSYPPEVVHLQTSLGYKPIFKGVAYGDGARFADNFFSVRYLLSNDPHPAYKFVGGQDLKLYENEQAYPIAFAAGQGIERFTFSDDPHDNARKLHAAIALGSPQNDFPLFPNPPASALTAVRWEKGHIEGAIDTEKDAFLLTTLPYDSAYEVRIDGTAVATFQMLGALLAAELPAGQHSIQIRYRPARVLAGALLSFASLGAAVYLFQKEKMRMPPLPAADQKNGRSHQKRATA